MYMHKIIQTFYFYQKQYFLGRKSTIFKLIGSSQHKSTYGNGLMEWYKYCELISHKAQHEKISQN